MIAAFIGRLSTSLARGIKLICALCIAAALVLAFVSPSFAAFPPQDFLPVSSTISHEESASVETTTAPQPSAPVERSGTVVQTGSLHFYNNTSTQVASPNPEAAVWELYDTGELVVGEGLLVRTHIASTALSPWIDYSDDITSIVFTGPIVPTHATQSFPGFFHGLTEVESIEGLEHLNFSSFRNVATGVYGESAPILYAFFRDTTSLTSLDGISNWNISRATNIARMFQGSSSIEYIDVSNWDTGNATQFGHMFSGATNLRALDTSNWDTSSATHMSNMFMSTSNLETLDVSNWDMRRVVSTSRMFENASSLEVIDVSSWDTPNLNSVYNMFWNASSVQTLDLSSWTMSNVTNITRMFQGTSSLTSIDVSNWDTSRVTNMNYVFWNASALTTIDLSDWDTSSVLVMNRMFEHASSLVSLDVSTWNTPNTTGMNRMFFGANSLVSLDLSSWNAQSVVQMAQMFQGATSLRVLDFSNWSTANVSSMSSMLTGTSALRQITLSEDFYFHPNAALQAVPGPPSYTGRWQNVGMGVPAAPTGAFSFTSLQMLALRDPAIIANTWVWQPFELEFSFTKTDSRLYEVPQVIAPLDGVVFSLYREVWDELAGEHVWHPVMVEVADELGNVTVEQQRATSGEEQPGHVTFTLPAGGRYRIVEDAPLSGYRPVPGYWILTIGDGSLSYLYRVQNTIPFMESSSDDYRIPPFVWAGEGGQYSWHLGNLRDTNFDFHKVDEAMNERVFADVPSTWAYIIDYLLPDADLSLFRFTGVGSPGPDQIVPLDLFDESTGSFSAEVPWELVGSWTSSAQPGLAGQAPMSYALDARFTYQLVELRAPESPIWFRTPDGQWRIDTVVLPYDSTLLPGDPRNEYPLNRVIRTQEIAEAGMPRAVEVGGIFYIGNREMQVVPAGIAAPASVTTPAIVAGILVLAVLGLAYLRNRRNK